MKSKVNAKGKGAPPTKSTKYKNKTKDYTQSYIT